MFAADYTVMDQVLIATARETDIQSHGGQRRGVYVEISAHGFMEDIRW